MPSKAKPTVHDLAKRSGWSLGTVSRVLNHVPGVSPKAIDDVMRAAAELGYTRNESAHALRRRAEDGILIVVNHNSSPHFLRQAERVASHLEEDGQSVHLCKVSAGHKAPRRQSPQEHPNPRQKKTCSFMEQTLDLLEAHHPRLLLLFGAERDDFVQAHGRISVPAICAGTDVGPLHHDGFLNIAIDEVERMQQAAEILFECGCRSIGLICGDPLKSSMEADRILGVQYAFYSRNQIFRKSVQCAIATSEDDMKSGAERRSVTKSESDANQKRDAKQGSEETQRNEAAQISEASQRNQKDHLCGPEQGYAAMVRLMKRMPDLDGLLVSSDLLAIGAMRAAVDHGRTIGDDLRVLALDECGLGAWSIPRLSTLSYDFEQEADEIEKALLQMIGFSGIEPPFTRIITDWTIDFRESCPQPDEWSGSAKEET